MIRFRRKHFYMTLSFVAVWFLLNIFYLGEIKSGSGLPDISRDQFIKNINKDAGDSRSRYHSEHAQNIAWNNTWKDKPVFEVKDKNYSKKKRSVQMKSAQQKPKEIQFFQPKSVVSGTQVRINEKSDKGISSGNNSIKENLNNRIENQMVKLKPPEEKDLSNDALNPPEVIDNIQQDNLDALEANDNPKYVKINGVNDAEDLEAPVIPDGDIDGQKPAAEASEDEADLTPDEKKDRADGFERHSFNVLASEAFDLDRDIPDFRPESCPKAHKMVGVATASIIICFHNEALSTLLRTVHSVVNRSPPDLVKEVILVDDASTYDYLGEKLEDALEDLAPTEVIMVRLAKRQGIVRARMWGVEKAEGEVLVFLDSHCECAVGWLPPLMQALRADPNKVVCPEVDIIKHDTFEYVRADKLHHGSFDWELRVVWKPLSAQDLQWRETESDPIRSAIMLGGIFAVNKKYFKQIGQYDRKMRIWGGENIELSFRVWMCGGVLEILPCSRVGHVFRPVIPYGFPNGNPKFVIAQNNQRVAEVWMDDFKRYFYALSKGFKQTPEMIESVYSRNLLRRSLKCHTFLWYLNNVAPDVPIPPRDTVYFGEMKQRSTGKCLEIQTFNRFYVMPCRPQHPSQVYHLDKAGRLMRGKQCLHYTRKPNKHGGEDMPLELSACSPSTMTCTVTENDHVECTVPSTSGTDTVKCLHGYSKVAYVALEDCMTFSREHQQWTFTHHFDVDKLNMEYFGKDTSDDES